jgi:hypothetical protein
MSLEQMLQENAEIGAGIIKKYLKGDLKGSDQVKIASLAITQCVKHQATRGAIDALKFAVARSIATNQNELKGQVKIILPGYIDVKAIEDKK